MPQLRSQRTRSSRRYEDSSPEAESGEETRCICGHAELQLPKKTEDSEDIDPGLFIQCDSCQVWQHGYCVGFYSEDEVPDVYYCEKCRPDLHLVVLRPSGKTSSYIPHLKELGQYNESDSEDAAEDDNKASVGSAAKNGNGNANGVSDDGVVNHSSNNNNNNNNNNDDDSENDQQQNQYQTSPTKELRSSRRDRATLSANSSRETSRNAKDKDKDRTHQRRRTQNSIRQYEYEETLKRVLEESVHDVPGKDKDELENGNGNSRVARDVVSSSRRRHTSGDAFKKEDEDGDREYQNYDNHNNSKNKHNKHEQSHEDVASDAKDTKDTGAGAGANGHGHDSPSRASRKRKSRGSGKEDSHRSSADDDHDDATETQSQSQTAGSGRKKPRHKGKSHGTSSNSGGTSSANAASSQSSAILTAKAKPRIPQARSTIPEMRKRVAAILEFIGRTQLDLAEEQEDRNRMLEDRRDRYKDELQDLQDGKFTEMFDFSKLLEALDSLTRKLLLWEQTYGRYGEETREEGDEQEDQEDQEEDGDGEEQSAEREGLVEA